MLVPKSTFTLIYFFLVITCKVVHSKKGEGPDIDPISSSHENDRIIRSIDMPKSLNYFISEMKSSFSYYNERDRCSFVYGLINGILDITTPCEKQTPPPQLCNPCKPIINPSQKCESWPTDNSNVNREPSYPNNPNPELGPIPYPLSPAHVPLEDEMESLVAYPGGVIYLRPPKADVVNGPNLSPNNNMEYSITPGIIVYQGILITPYYKAPLTYDLYIIVQPVNPNMFVARETLLPQDFKLLGVLRIPGPDDDDWVSSPFDLNNIIPTQGLTIDIEQLRSIMLSVLPRNLGPPESIEIIFPHRHQLTFKLMIEHTTAAAMLVPGFSLPTQIRHIPGAMEYMITFPNLGKHIGTIMDILRKTNPDRDLPGIDLREIIKTLKINSQVDIIFKMHMKVSLQKVTEQLKEIVTYILLRFINDTISDVNMNGIKPNIDFANPSEYPQFLPVPNTTYLQLPPRTKYPGGIFSNQSTPGSGSPQPPPQSRYPGGLPSDKLTPGGKSHLILRKSSALSYIETTRLPLPRSEPLQYGGKLYRVNTKSRDSKESHRVYTKSDDSSYNETTRLPLPRFDPLQYGGKSHLIFTKSSALSYIKYTYVPLPTFEPLLQYDGKFHRVNTKSRDLKEDNILYTPWVQSIRWKKWNFSSSKGRAS